MHEMKRESSCSSDDGFSSSDHGDVHSSNHSFAWQASEAALVPVLSQLQHLKSLTLISPTREGPRGPVPLILSADIVESISGMSQLTYIELHGMPRSDLCILPASVETEVLATASTYSHGCALTLDFRGPPNLKSLTLSTERRGGGVLQLPTSKLTYLKILPHNSSLDDIANEQEVFAELLVFDCARPMFDVERLAELVGSMPKLRQLHLDGSRAHRLITEYGGARDYRKAQFGKAAAAIGACSRLPSLSLYHFGVSLAHRHWTSHLQQLSQMQQLGLCLPLDISGGGLVPLSGWTCLTALSLQTWHSQEEVAGLRTCFREFCSSMPQLQELHFTRTEPWPGADFLVSVAKLTNLSVLSLRMDNRVCSNGLSCVDDNLSLLTPLTRLVEYGCQRGYRSLRWLLVS